VFNHSGANEVVISNVRKAIREVFGSNSPGFAEHQYVNLYAGSLYMGMPDHEYLKGLEFGRQKLIVKLNGLIDRLKEKKEDLIGGSTFSSPSIDFDRLDVHPRISDVSRELFSDGHPWEAVFAASKALVNFVKERSGRYDLDGANLARMVFSRNNPLLAFNDMSDTTDRDEQEGMMHLFECVILGIRKPGGHSFPEWSELRALEYISLISLLAYRVQEAKRIKQP